MGDAEAAKIADEAELIVNGYAFSKLGANIRAVNLRTGKAAVFAPGGVAIETNMDDVDVALAARYLDENIRFMG